MMIVGSVKEIATAGRIMKMNKNLNEQISTMQDRIKVLQAEEDIVYKKLTKIIDEKNKTFNELFDKIDERNKAWKIKR